MNHTVVEADAGRQITFDLPRRQERQERKTVLVRMLPQEKEGLQRLAKASEMSLSAFCAEILRSVLRHAGTSLQEGAGQ